MGIPINGIKPNMAITYNNDLYIVITCEHSRTARGPAFCRTKLRNFKTSQVIDATLRDSDNIEKVFIDKRKLQYTYNDDHMYHFLDLETYEDLVLSKSVIEDKIIWFKDDLKLIGLSYDNQLLDLELPSSLELRVVETDPGFRGDTVKQGTKSAKLETGVRINVPLFINNGEVIKVDTKNKEYQGRA